ncbi:MAG: phosphoenolpyruvate synthase [Bacteroidales bacterium]|nr:phosphoenolpyruvate synthase [Bacteroidales bacterium]MCF8399336.1 phosphoenolpyruvate synthase [Bacteroidales bacterium]
MEQVKKKFSIDAKKFYFNDTSFNILMKKRIYHVLLISSAYDAFTLEDDGRIDEQIFNEYVSLNLRYPPQFMIAHSEEKAFEMLEEGNIDLVITMLSADEKDTFDLAKNIKARYSDIPIVVLTPFSREVSVKVSQEDFSAIDYIFSWLGNADILLAIIKLIEDKMNVEFDVREVGVQVIILVEDSIRFYSSYLPNMYKIIFKQSKTFMTEGLNEHQKMLRMRGRPKIMLATNYEEAIGFYEKYKKNLLGVISDLSYKRNDKKDKLAGYKLAQRIKMDDKWMPVLLQSSDTENAKLAKKLGVGFINKNSKTLSIELRNFIREYFAFGDFIFQNPETGKEIARAEDLKTLQEMIFQIPDTSLQYHIVRNHFSKWLRARALFPLAEMFKGLTPDDFSDLDEIKRFLFDAIASFRLNKARGVIAEFNRERFDEYFTFSRIGDGSIGGKARGLAFLDSLIKRNRLFDKYENVHITIPRTVVLCTDVFDEFMEDNNLYKVALSDMTDNEILQKFTEARLPFRIHEDLYTFVSVVRNPIAIRSSSLLEDSHYQPFAGIYSTYMIPNIPDDERRMIENLSNAIKSVYASAFFRESKAYMAATANVIDEEKMAIVLQEVCGKKYENRFYPTFSGVARSVNFYPIEPEKSEDGIANIAMGLGKYIVDGGVTLRFSPKFPKKVLQTSSPALALKETQRKFFALDLDTGSFSPNTDDGVNLLKLRVKDADQDGSLRFIASTYDYQNDVLRDSINYEGKRLVTFSNILKHNTFPLAEIISNVLRIGQQEMAKPVEIEFAVELNRKKSEPRIFNLLQIRPIVENNQTINKDLTKVSPKKCIVYSETALGNGIIKGIHDVVYVKPDNFDPAKSPEIADQIGELNEKFIDDQKNFVLIGPGRWGSADHWLGIPVRWAQISMARVIVESGMEGYHIDPSQGTHFFQNLTSFRVGYLTVNPHVKQGHFDDQYLSKIPAVYEDDHIRHIRFDKNILIEIDGKKKIGIVYKA